MSLESQLSGFFTSSQPSSLQTASASSRSNPVYSPFSSIYPYGGYSASNPTVNVFLSSTLSAVFASSPDALFFSPHPASTIAAIAVPAKISANFFFIFVSSLFVRHYAND